VGRVREAPGREESGADVKKPKNPNALSSLRLSPEMMRALDIRVGEERRKHPLHAVSRADVVREILAKALQ